MKLSAIRERLIQLRVAPSKSLGQNFLHDQNLARWLVAQIDPQPGEHIVEIGPGLGALTGHVLATGATAMVIEKDGRLVAHLRERFADEIRAGRFEVVHGDAADFDVRTLWPRGPVKVLGNLPYYITTPLLFHFTAPASPTASALFVMQRELAERLAAGPAQAKDYGILSLVVQRRWRVKYLRTLPAGVFTPAPKVESGAVLLTPRAPGELPPCDGATFERLVRRGFSQRRKQIGKLLAAELATAVAAVCDRPSAGDDEPSQAVQARGGHRPSLQWAEICAQLGVSETARAEELSLEQWIALANLVRPVVPGAAQDGVGERFDVVDEANRVVGAASRAEVHARNLRHRAMHLFVFNAAGELFLQKRSPWKDSHPGKWDSSASGHLDADESYEAAAQRELREELGLDDRTAEGAELCVLGDLGAARPETNWEFIRLFSACAEGPFRWPPEEIEWGGFFSVEVIQSWIVARPHDFAPGFLECWALWWTLQPHS